MTEILAPCGSPEVLTAALRTGCTAVYLGGEDFSARAGAKNFTPDELAQAVRLCHERGVKVYQAINTVVTDKELPRLREAVRTACALGIDGLITQDLAVVMLVRECCPELELHASTQMTLHTAEGFMFAKELGFSRAVASRELPEHILRELCSLPIECEVFVHGALCMSVSGQCYMSAVIGQRSANRGQCAQACRLPVSAVINGREEYALSLKDMSHLSHLHTLEAMGAASLKIEGRMKRPEYVAAASNAVRSELEDSEYDRSLLEGVFSRSGFTDGYFTGRLGRDMFGHRSRSDVEASAGAIPALHELYRREFKRSAADLRIVMRRGEKVTAEMTDENGLTVTVSGSEPQEALRRAADKEYLIAQFSKLGDTIYTLNSLECEIGEGLTLPAGELSAMRRELCSEMDDKRYKYYTRRPAFTDAELSLAEPRAAHLRGMQPHKLRIYISREEQLSELELSGAELVCAELSLAEKLLGGGFGSDKLCAVMPRFTFDEKRDAERLAALTEQGLKHMECTNYAHIRIGRSLGLTLHGGFGLNVTNTLALRALRESGLADCTVSFELKASEINALGGELPFGAIGYGRLPMMLTVNCPIKAQRGCKGCTGAVYDRTGRRMPVRCSQRQGYVEILNSDILCISDRLADFAAANHISLIFNEEQPGQVREITAAFRQGIRPAGEGFTKGLYYRGVSGNTHQKKDR